MSSKAARSPAHESVHVREVPPILKQAFAESNSATAIFDTNGSLLFANIELRKLADAFATNDATLANLVPDDQTSAACVAFERFRAGRSDLLRARYAIRCHSGKRFWIDLSARRETFTPGDQPLTIVQFFDVTETYEARAEMDRNNARWETALAAAGQGMWEFDGGTGKLTVSHGWKRLRGIPDDEEITFSREDWLKRLHPEDRDRIDTTSRKQGHEAGFDVLEYRERHRDGHYIWIYSRGRPYAWGCGRCTDQHDRHRYRCDPPEGG